MKYFFRLKKIIIISLFVISFHSLLIANEEVGKMDVNDNSPIADERIRQFIRPTRILWISDSTNKVLKNSKLLLEAKNSQPSTGKEKHCEMRGNTKKRPAILLDFGKELHGSIRITTGMAPKGKQCLFRVCLGESAAEAMSVIGEKTGATNDHAMRDFEIVVPWLGSVEVGSSGFRFARIELLDTSGLVYLKSVMAVEIMRNIKAVGAFRCNDERLNKIWAVGAHTVHLNMQEYLWDGIKRDRLVWVGDMHPEVMTINAVFGYNSIVPQSLDVARDAFPSNTWINGISAYSLWWIIIHHEWYKNNGDLDYLKQQRKYLSVLLSRLHKCVDENNSEKLDGMRFLDWPSSENQPAVHAGLQALLIIAMESASDICTIIGDKDEAIKCSETVTKLRKHIPDNASSKPATALMGMCGLIPSNEASALILKDSTKDFSTFYGYYMLQALAKDGKYTEAMNIIKTYWGAMLDLGATSFWEDFNMDWIKGASRIDELPKPGEIDIHSAYGAFCYKGFRHSLAHGWASGPTPWLSQHVLGFEVVEYGCKTVSIKPHLGDLLWAEGSFPTPYGIIKVRHEKQSDGTIKTTIDAPKEVKIVR